MDLGYVETIIAFAGVMSILGVFVTALVQAVLMMLNMRMFSLKWGIEKLLFLAAGQPHKDVAKQVAKKILAHNAVSTMWGWWGRSEALSKKELKMILSDLANDAGVKTLQAAASNLNDKTQEWFETVMERTTETFVRYSRVLSIIISVLLAIWLQIDSIHIFKQLSVSESTREQVVTKAFELQEERGNQRLATDFASQALQAANKELQAAAQVTDGLTSKIQGRQWIETRIPQAEQPKWVDAYENAWKRLIEDKSSEIAALKATIDQGLGLELFNPVKPSDSRWLGILLSTIFISLGAPFWFNLLKTFSNLRPIIAQKVENKVVQ